MLKNNTAPLVCATYEGPLSLWFVLLDVIRYHPLLNADEKTIWSWLTLHVAKDVNDACSFSYQQLSQAMDMDISCKRIHRSLFRFRLMGFLKADIPVWYGELTPEMEDEVRILVPLKQ